MLFGFAGGQALAVYPRLRTVQSCLTSPLIRWCGRVPSPRLLMSPNWDEWLKHQWDLNRNLTNCCKGKCKALHKLFFVARKRTLFSSWCRGTGAISVPSPSGSSWGWLLSPALLWLLTVLWFHLAALDCTQPLWHTLRTMMDHNNFRAHGIPWVRQGVNRRGRSLNTDTTMLIWASNYFRFSLNQILLLYWNRWSPLLFLSPQVILR